MACGGYPLLSSITLYYPLLPFITLYYPLLPFITLLPDTASLHLCISASRISGDIRPLILADTAVPVR